MNGSENDKPVLQILSGFGSCYIWYFQPEFEGTISTNKQILSCCIFLQDHPLAN